ncbi:MAG: FkbM family methyltransferase, partial [Bacteroidia bacterium]|nr:FkbM family methyltransferase [Bacteroidia bacterium]
IIDAGANIGLAAVYFSNRFPDAKIYSIEPESSNLELMRKNIAPYPNVRVIPKALHHSSGLELQIVDEGIGEWGFTTRNTGNTAEKKQVVGTVETVSIDSILEEHEIGILDILKIDIEGAEKPLFEKNYRNWIPRTRCIIVELHDRWYPGCRDSVFRAIDEFNFTHFEKGENVIFLNKELI